MGRVACGSASARLPSIETIDHAASHRGSSSGRAVVGLRFYSTRKARDREKCARAGRRPRCGHGRRGTVFRPDNESGGAPPRGIALEVPPGARVADLEVSCRVFTDGGESRPARRGFLISEAPPRLMKAQADVDRGGEAFMTR